MDRKTETSEPIAERDLYLGTKFERLVNSQLELSPATPQSLGVLASLITNETFEFLQIKEIRESRPDGYIFGAGFGNILSMIDLFPSDSTPKAVLAVDIDPRVVVLGRVFVNIMAASKNFDDLVNVIGNPDLVYSAYDALLSTYSGKEKLVLSPVPFEDVFNTFSNFLATISQETGSSSIYEVLSRNFGKFHQLAKEGNIGVAYGDMSESKIIQIVNNMPNFATSSNIIYLSNIIDHITKRGTDPQNYSLAYNFSALNGSGKNWFIHTTASQDYVLEAKTTSPTYGFKQ